MDTGSTEQAAPEQPLRIGIVGAGTMGEIIIRGLIARSVVRACETLASAPRAERREALTAAYPGLRVVESNAEAVAGADVVVLTVKPQTLPSVLADIREALTSDQLVLSIVTGATVKALESGAYHPAIVRAMTNTLCQVGEGMTVWVASRAVTERQLGYTRRIFGALGREIEVHNENYLDMATSINGSGPAYIFLVMEALTDAGVQIGLPRYMAEELVTQTMLGAARLAIETKQHPAALKNAVTSPGGTTAAALYNLEKGGLRSTMAEAVIAAYQRAVALGRAEDRPDRP